MRAFQSELGDSGPNAVEQAEQAHATALPLHQAGKRVGPVTARRHCCRLR